MLHGVRGHGIVPESVFSGDVGSPGGGVVYFLEEAEAFGQDLVGDEVGAGGEVIGNESAVFEDEGGDEDGVGGGGVGRGAVREGDGGEAELVIRADGAGVGKTGDAGGTVVVFCGTAEHGRELRAGELADNHVVGERVDEQDIQHGNIAGG